MMNYNDLREWCKKHYIPVTTVAREVGITISGVKYGLNNKSMALRFIPQLCKSLGMSPNEFFGYKEKEGSSYSQVQNGGVGNVQNMESESIAILHEQLRKKDEQIDKLLALMAENQ